MGDHVSSQPPLVPLRAQGDHVRLAYERIQLFSAQWFFDKGPATWFPDKPGCDETTRELFRSRIGTVETNGLEDAALTVLADLQARLEAGGQREYGEAVRLAGARAAAVRALIHLHGEQQAKMRVREVAPLTICTGDRQRIRLAARSPRTLHPMLGKLGYSADGCGAVFSDNAVMSGNSMWPSFCPRCQSEHKKPGRTAERALKKKIRSARSTEYGAGFAISPDAGFVRRLP